MKKFLKILSIIILSLIACYTIFIIEESVRLSKNQHSKPLIIINEYSDNNTTRYESIGFHLTNKYGAPGIDEKAKVICIGQEIWLFNHFLIWGWIS